MTVHTRTANDIIRVGLTFAAIALLASGAVAWRAISATPQPSSYRNAPLGFDITPPDFKFDSAAPVSMVAQFYASPVNGFAANINVQVHRTTFDDFCNATASQFKSAGMTVVSTKDTKVGDNVAREYVYSGKISGVELEFLALAVSRGKDTYLFTCTSLASDFAKLEPPFRAALATLQFDALHK